MQAPQVWLKGGDRTAAEIVEAAAVKRHGGRAVRIPLRQAVSMRRVIACIPARCRGMPGGPT